MKLSDIIKEAAERDYKGYKISFDEETGSWIAKKDGKEVVRYEASMQSVMKRIDAEDFE